MPHRAIVRIDQCCYISFINNSQFCCKSPEVVLVQPQGLLPTHSQAPNKKQFVLQFELLNLGGSTPQRYCRLIPDHHNKVNIAIK